MFIVKTVTLAAGGESEVKSFASNPDVATGDGVAASGPNTSRLCARMAPSTPSWTIVTSDSGIESRMRPALERRLFGADEEPAQQRLGS